MKPTTLQISTHGKTTSQSSIDPILFNAYGNNDLDSLRQILSPEIEWVIPGQHPLSGTKHGVDEVLDYFKHLQRCHFGASPIVMGCNDEYVIDCHLNWSNRKNGENMKRMSCLLWQFAGGKIVKVYNFPEDQHIVDAFFNEAYTDLH